MFSSLSSFDALPLKLPENCAPQDSAESVVAFSSRRSRGDRELTLQSSRSDQPIARCAPGANIASRRTVSRRGTVWRGMSIELVKAGAQERLENSFHSSSHLLVAYQQGVRCDGESYVDGVPPSKLRDLAKKLILVPAGHRYCEWHDLRIPASVTYVQFDTAELKIDLGQTLLARPLSPRLFFEDATIWNTVEKLRQAVDAPRDRIDELYVEALGTVLLHEIFRLNKVGSPVEPMVKGGLAAWQQRIVAAHIEEHLSEQVSLATLARLARLSTFHFCRAFRQSFGVPPHRYHTTRRIERAKAMLAERKHSVTEIGLAVGFSETSSFTAAFRKITGQSPSRYHRALG